MGVVLVSIVAIAVILKILLIIAEILFSAGKVVFLVTFVLLIAGVITLKLKKKKVYEILFKSSIVGIIIGTIFITSSIGIPFIIKKIISSPQVEIIDTGTMIYWEANESRKKFIYNDRTYRELSLSRANFYAEADEAITNITERKTDSTDETTSLLYDRVIYSLKNCDDFSLLSTSNYPAHYNLYCDEDFYSEKKGYYENMDNYNKFISRTEEHFPNRTGKEIVSYPLSEEDFDVLEKIKYGSRDDHFSISKNKEYEYIYIFGNSHDGIGQSLFNSFLADGNILYYRVSRGYKDFTVVELSDEQKNMILSLLD